MRFPSPRTVAVALNTGRVAIGAVGMAGPRGTELLVGAQGRPPVPQLLSKMAGARDIALGAASLAALRRSRPPRLLLALGAFCDGVDLVAALRTPGLPTDVKARVAAAAAPATALGAWLAVARWNRAS